MPKTSLYLCIYQSPHRVELERFGKRRLNFQVVLSLPPSLPPFLFSFQQRHQQQLTYSGTSSIIPTAPSLPTVMMTSPKVFVANPASQ